MSTTLDKQIRRTEFISGLSLTIAIGLSLAIGLLLTHRLWLSFKMAALLVKAVMIVQAKHCDRNKSRLMGSAFSIIAISEGYEFYINLSAMFKADSDELEYFLWPSVTGMICSAFCFTAAALCALVYMEIISLIRRRTLMIFIYSFIAACVLPLSLEISKIVTEVTLLLSLCFFPKNNSIGTKLGKVGRLSITVFPAAVVAVAVIMLITALSPVLIFDPEAAEYDMDSAKRGSAVMAAGPIILLIMVLLFPLMLFDKKFESRETNEKTVL